MSAGAAFWSARVRRYGHTGWSDAATYCYDQRLRLKAVREVVSTLPKPATALDYGCGVGDFCSLLSGLADQVVGYDLSADVIARAQRDNAAPNLRYLTDAGAVWTQPYDLILSITVLQHVVDDAELKALLCRFAAALTPQGRVVVLETLADATHDAGYLKRRTAAQLLAAFAEAGLAPVLERGFYHPSECPTPAYRAYRQGLVVRGLARLSAWRLAPARQWLRRIAQRAADADAAYLDQASSPTRLFVFAAGPA